MSSVSGTSNKREKNIQELEQELESIRAMNSTLRAYMDHLKIFKSNLIAMNNNYKQLSKVNSLWIDTISSK